MCLTVFIDATMRDRGGVQENERWGDCRETLTGFLSLSFRIGLEDGCPSDGHVRW